MSQILRPQVGNTLLVSNYPSDTTYAWWLMEHFWLSFNQIVSECGSKTFLCYPKITQLPQNIQDSTISTVELTLPWTNPTEKQTVLEFLKRHDIQNLYFTDQPFFNTQYLLYRLSGVKHIIVHDHTPGDRPPATGIKKLYKTLRNQFPFTSADAVLCVSELMRQRDISNVCVPPGKCYTVQNGIPPVTFEKDRLQVRKELGISSNEFVSITTGRAHPYKRFDLVIRAAQQIFKQRPDAAITLLFAGDGPALDELSQLVADMGLAHKVKLLGFRKDIKDLLGASDIAIHAALGEGFSLSITEYMGAGLPVLVPAIPSVSQAIVHGENGFIFSKDDECDLASYVLKLADNPDLRTQLGNKAKDDMLEKYSLDKCTEVFKEVIETVLKQ